MSVNSGLDETFAVQALQIEEYKKNGGARALGSLGGS